MKRAFIAISGAVLAAAALAPAQSQTTQVSPSVYSISGWRLECSSERTALSCQVLDQVLARANNAVIAGVSVREAADGKTPVLIVQVPLGVAVDQPVHLGFSGGVEQVLPFVSCFTNGCFARAPLGDALLSAMRTAKQPLSLTYANLDSSMNKQSIKVTLPLDGFAVAYDKLK